MNESGMDRVIRVALGIVLAAVGMGMGLSGVAGILLLVVGLVSLVTGIIGFCPIYAMFKLHTTRA